MQLEGDYGLRNVASQADPESPIFLMFQTHILSEVLENLLNSCVTSILLRVF